MTRQEIVNLLAFMPVDVEEDIAEGRKYHRVALATAVESATCNHCMVHMDPCDLLDILVGKIQHILEVDGNLSHNG